MGERPSERRLSKVEADAVEVEMRRLLADPDVSKNEVRLFMQHPMSCGHAAGNLLTCDTPPWGCVICNAALAPEGPTDA